MQVVSIELDNEMIANGATHRWEGISKNKCGKKIIYIAIVPPSNQIYRGGRILRLYANCKVD
jgi:hypothetical protein